MKITNAWWFTELMANRPIGIVLCHDEVENTHKAYIGTGDGFDEGEDAKNIVANGARFPISSVKGLS